jgi:tape measure domain-containing protein
VRQNIDILVRLLGNANSLVSALRGGQAALRAYGSAVVSLNAATSTGTRALGQLASSARTTSSILLQTFLRVQQASGGLGRSLVELGRSAFYLTALVNTVRSLGQAAVDLGRSLVQPAADAERASIAFEHLLGSADAATAMLGKLRDFAKNTPFDFPQVRGLTQQLLAVEVPASRVIEILTAVGDAVAGVGGGNEELNSVIRAITQIQARGRLAAEEMLQLTEARIPAWQLLAKEMGVSVGELQDMVTKGLVPASAALPGLIAGMDRAFGGQMARQSQATLGIIANIRDTFDLLRTIFGEPVRIAVTEQLQRFLQYISGPDAQRRAAFLGNAVASGIGVAARAFQSLSALVGRIFTNIDGVLSRVGGSFAGFVGLVMAALEPLGSAVSRLLQGDLQGAVRLARTGMQAIGAVIFAVLREIAPGLFQGGSNTIAAFAEGMIAGAARYVYRALTYITGLIADWLRGFSPPRKGPLSTIDQWFPKVLDAYLGSWTDADWGALDDLTERVAEAFEDLVAAGQISAEGAAGIVVGTGDQAGLNQLIAQVIDSIQRTGQASAEAMLEIEALLGQQGRELFAELQARFANVALDKQIRDLRAQLAGLSDPDAERRLNEAISRAEDQLRGARTREEARAAREHLGFLKARENANDRQRSALEQQIAALERQQQLVVDQIAGQETIARLRERELAFVEKIFDIQRGGGDDRAQAEFDYQVAIADTETRLDLYRKKLAGLEEGSAEYFRTLTQVKQLEQQLADERARAAQEAEEAARRREEAEWQYRYAIADNAGKLQLVRDKLRGVEEGSEAYYQLLTQQQQLEAQIAEERARAAEEAEEAAKRRTEAEWQYRFAIADQATQLQMLRDRLGTVDADSEEGYRLRTEIAEREAAAQQAAQEAAERLADAQWELAFATADTAGKIALLEERRAGLTESDAEYYDLTRQIIELQQEQEAAAQRRAEAEWQYAYATADTATRLEMVRAKLGEVEAGSVEYYDLLTQQAALEKQLREEQEAAAKEAADAAKARADAEWAYNYAIADTAGKLAMLREKLGEVEVGSVEYFDLLTQIADLQRQQADEAARLAEQRATEAQRRADAEWEYYFAIADTAGKLAMLREKLARTPVGSVEYWELLKQIYDLEQRAAKEAADGANTRGAAWQNEAGGIGEFIDKVGGLAEEGKRQWDEWTKAFDQGKTKIKELKDEFLAFFDVQDKGQRRWGGEMTGDEPGFPIPESSLGANLAVIAAALINLFSKAFELLQQWLDGDGKVKLQGVFGVLQREFNAFINNPDLIQANKGFDENVKKVAETLVTKLIEALTEAWTERSDLFVDHLLDWAKTSTFAGRFINMLFGDGDAEDLYDNTPFERLFNDIQRRMDLFKDDMDIDARDVVQSIGGWWLWLYTYLVGNSVIPDLVNESLDWFDTLGTDSVKAVTDLVGSYSAGGGGVLGKAYALSTGFTDGVAGMVGSYSAGGGGALGSIFTLKTDAVEGVLDLVGSYTSGGGGALGAVFTLVDESTGAVTGWVGSYSAGGGGVLGDIFALRTDAVAGISDLVGTYAAGGGGALGFFFTLVTTAQEQITQWVGTYAAGNTGLLGLAFALQKGFTDGVSSLVGAYASGGGGALGLIWTLQDSGTRGVSALVGSYSANGGGALGILHGMVMGGEEALAAFVGDWAANTGGVLGNLYALWATITDKGGDLLSALTKPFSDAGSSIGEIVTTFGNNIINVLNDVLRRIGVFINGFRGAVNWIAEKLGVGAPFPDAYDPPQIEGLARGTRNWRGGWARTGEEGEEIAILPRGTTSQGNLTFLPQGTQVIPNSRMYEKDDIRGFEPVGDDIFTPNEDGTIGSLIPAEILELWAWVRKGPKAILAEAFDSSLDLPGVFRDVGTKIATNVLDWGVETVKRLIDEFLDEWGLGGWGGTPDAPADQPAEGTGDYPTGMGLGAAMAAIIDGAYLTQRFSSGHPGIDIGAGGWPMNGKKWVRALEGGTVIASSFNDSLEGEYIMVQDSRGRIYYYGHGYPGSRRFQRGASIGRGASMMLMGATGQADGPHVHFELRLPNGQSVNPEQVFSGALRFAKGGIIREPIVGYGLTTGQKYAFGEEGDEIIVPITRQSQNLGATLVPLLQSLRLGIQNMLASVNAAMVTNTYLTTIVAGIEATLAQPQFALQAADARALRGDSATALAAVLRRIEFKPEIHLHGSDLTEDQARRVVKDAFADALDDLWLEIQREQGG